MKHIAPIYLLFVFVGCSQGVLNTSASDVDRGAFDGRQYQNDRLGFSLTVPESWEIEDYDILGWDHFDLAVSEFMATYEKEHGIRESDEHAYFGLFSLIKPTTSYHPIIVLGYLVDLEILNGISTAEEYLHHLSERHPGSPRITISNVSSGNLGNREFSAISINISGVFRRMEYATKIDSYLLLLSITSDSSDGLAEGRQLLNSVRFNH